MEVVNEVNNLLKLGLTEEQAIKSINEVQKEKLSSFIEAIEKYKTENSGKELTDGKLDVMIEAVKEGKTPEEIVKIIEGVGNPSLTEPSLPKGGELTEEEIEMLTSKQNSLGHQAELDTAKLLKKEGYDIKPLKEGEGDAGNGYGLNEKSNPDYLIEGKPFDCYAPESKNPKTVVKEISRKNKEQAERITLNLDNYKGDIAELKDLILRKTNGDLKNLKELLVVKDGEITRWFARGE